MPDDASLPEMARSLRALGASRDRATESAHDAIFTPLLEARVRASRLSGRDVVGALRGATVAEQIERGVVSAAVEGVEQPAVARARASEARELIHTVRDALMALDDRATGARSAGPGTAEWDAWLAALRAVFAAADEACNHLARLLAVPPRVKERSRWFRSRGS